MSSILAPVKDISETLKVPYVGTSKSYPRDSSTIQNNHEADQIEINNDGHSINQATAQVANQASGQIIHQATGDKVHQATGEHVNLSTNHGQITYNINIYLNCTDYDDDRLILLFEKLTKDNK